MQGAGQGAGQIPTQARGRANVADSPLFSPAFPRLVEKQAAAGYFAGSHQNGVRLRIAAASVPSSR